MTSEILSTLRHLPPDAQVTITVPAHELVRALEDRDDRPERVVTTTELEGILGMSGEWWRRRCSEGVIPEAWQDGERSPWHLPLGAARRYLETHRTERTRSRSRRRGPRQPRGTP